MTIYIDPAINKDPGKITAEDSERVERERNAEQRRIELYIKTFENCRECKHFKRFYNRSPRCKYFDRDIINPYVEESLAFVECNYNYKKYEEIIKFAKKHPYYFDDFNNINTITDSTECKSRIKKEIKPKNIILPELCQSCIKRLVCDKDKTEQKYEVFDCKDYHRESEYSGQNESKSSIKKDIIIVLLLLFAIVLCLLFY